MSKIKNIKFLLCKAWNWPSFIHITNIEKYIQHSDVLSIHIFDQRVKIKELIR